MSVQLSGSDIAGSWFSLGLLTPRLDGLVSSLVFGARKFVLGGCSVLGMSAGLP